MPCACDLSCYYEKSSGWHVECHPQMTSISARRCFLSLIDVSLAVEIIAARNKSTNTREIVEGARVVGPLSPQLTVVRLL